MKQINTNSLYDLGKYLQQLRDLPSDPAQLNADHLGILYVARWWLKSFLDSKEIPIEISQDTGTNLLDLIISVSDKKSKNETMESYDISNIVYYLGQFETVLAAELQKQLTYVVSQVSGYSMPLLVNKAEINLQEDAIKKGLIPDNAKKDFREAGRCLAFELPTAAGFHTMRATEAVLRKYYKLVTGKDAEASNLDWGTCTQELKKSNADKKVVLHVDQIRDLHRNPLMHPQDYLDMKQALGLFDISKSAINAMAEEISKLEGESLQLPLSAVEALAGAPEYPVPPVTA